EAVEGVCDLPGLARLRVETLAALGDGRASFDLLGDIGLAGLQLAPCDSVLEDERLTVIHRNALQLIGLDAVGLGVLLEFAGEAVNVLLFLELGNLCD